VTGRIKDSASGEDRVGIVDESLVGPISGVAGQVFLQVVQFQPERVIEAFVGHMRRDELRVLAHSVTPDCATFIQMIGFPSDPWRASFPVWW